MQGPSSAAFYFMQKKLSRHAKLYTIPEDRRRETLTNRAVEYSQQ